jgi:glycosyltransferase involved in cell wall biosynthesis
VNITVIVCTYNRAETLAKTLDSLAASILPEPISWEVLVVDNNSHDQTREVVEEFCHRYPGRFRYLFEPQQGLSHARNTGIREAQGDVLAFTDDDVILEPAWLQNLTAALHNSEWAGAGGRIVALWTRPIPSWLSTDDPRVMGPFVAFDPGTEAGPLTRPPYGANMAFRRQVFEKHGVFRADLGRSGNNLQGREDIEFGNRLLAAGERLRYEPHAIVRHLVPESRMQKGYVLRWWFWYGRTEVADSGPPSDSRWRVGGVPLYLVRRLARWMLQWMIPTSASRHFTCRLNIYYLAGITVACYQWARRQNAQGTVVRGATNSNPEREPSQSRTRM